MWEHLYVALAALQRGWRSPPGQTSAQTPMVPPIRRRWGKGRNESKMNSGVTTSLKEARVAREDSHRLLLHEKHSKKDVRVDICRSVPTPPLASWSLFGEKSSLCIALAGGKSQSPFRTANPLPKHPWCFLPGLWLLIKDCKDRGQFYSNR